MYSLPSKGEFDVSSTWMTNVRCKPLFLDTSFKFANHDHKPCPSFQQTTFVPPIVPPSMASIVCRRIACSLVRPPQSAVGFSMIGGGGGESSSIFGGQPKRHRLITDRAPFSCSFSNSPFLCITGKDLVPKPSVQVQEAHEGGARQRQGRHPARRPRLPGRPAAARRLPSPVQRVAHDVGPHAQLPVGPDVAALDHAAQRRPAKQSQSQR